MKMNNKRLPKMIYMEMKLSNHGWFENVKNLFLSINARDVLECNLPIINDKQFYNYVEGKLMSDYSPEGLPSYGRNQELVQRNQSFTIINK